VKSILHKWWSMVENTCLRKIVGKSESHQRPPGVQTNQFKLSNKQVHISIPIKSKSSHKTFSKPMQLLQLFELENSESYDLFLITFWEFFFREKIEKFRSFHSNVYFSTSRAFDDFHLKYPQPLETFEKFGKHQVDFFLQFT
jgi:hypothetical protein